MRLACGWLACGWLACGWHAAGKRLACSMLPAHCYYAASILVLCCHYAASILVLRCQHPASILLLHRNYTAAYCQYIYTSKSAHAPLASHTTPCQRYFDDTHLEVVQFRLDALPLVELRRLQRPTKLIFLIDFFFGIRFEFFVMSGCENTDKQGTRGLEPAWTTWASRRFVAHACPQVCTQVCMHVFTNVQFLLGTAPCMWQLL